LIYRKVLDIDLITKYSKLPPKNEDFIERIIEKTAKCPFFVDSTVKLSSFKGFRIFLFCSIDCDICRMCYDDDKHFAYDLNRPEYARNISFDKKEKIKIEAKNT